MTESPSRSIDNFPFFGIEEYEISADICKLAEDEFELILVPTKYTAESDFGAGIILQTMIVEGSIEKVYTKLKMLFDLGFFHIEQFDTTGTIFDANGDTIGEVDWSKFGNVLDTDIEPEVK